MQQQLGDSDYLHESTALAEYPLGSQDGKWKSAMCVAVFHIGRIRWYVLEGGREGENFILYCIACGMAETEYGYASVREMEAIEVDGDMLLASQMRSAVIASPHGCAVETVVMTYCNCVQFSGDYAFRGSSITQPVIVCLSVLKLIPTLMIGRFSRANRSP